MCDFTLFSDILFVFVIQWRRASSPLQEGEIQYVPPCMAVHKENVYIAVNLLDNKMKLFRSADFGWQMVTVPDGAICCDGLASDGESLFLYYFTEHSHKPFLGRHVDDSWIISKCSCPNVRYWPGMCVREGQVHLVGGDSEGIVSPHCTSYNIECDTWSQSFPNLPLPQARAWPNLLCMDNEWYVIGGRNRGCEPLSNLRLTNAGNVTYWKESQIHRLLQGAAIAEYFGWLFAIGGGHPDNGLVSFVQCVNTKNGELVQLPSLPNNRFCATLAVFRDKLVLFGGHPLETEWHIDDLLILDISK